MKIYQKLINNIDRGLISTLLLIILMGLLCLYSATRSVNPGIFTKQLLWLLIGLTSMVIFFAMDYRVLKNIHWPLYLITVVLLACVLVFGRDIAGARRWFAFGHVSFQPSELAKIVLVIWIASYGSKKKGILGYNIRDLIFPFVVILLPVVLILLEPDLGTSGIIVLIATGLFLTIGIQGSSLVALTSMVAISLPAGWLFLKDYQRKRILAFLDPTQDPLGSSYCTIQSKIAIGSGRLLGKGFLHGTQTQLRFLPEHHTDFIFSVVAEEWGFIGAGILVLLYLLLITKIISIGTKAKDRFGALVCFGIAIYFILHVFINIAMALGIIPVVGVPLPFISYGGSSLLVSMTCIGIVLSISWRRFIF